MISFYYNTKLQNTFIEIIKLIQFKYIERKNEKV